MLFLTILVYDWGMKTPLTSKDLLFQRIRSLSLSGYLSLSQDLPHEQAWRWTEKKTSYQWSLLGRLGYLWLYQKEKNHWRKQNEVAQEVIAQSLRSQDDPWHESIPGKPDILIFWLGSQLHPMKDIRLGNLLYKALQLKNPGTGERNDGGWLDQSLTLLEERFNSLSQEQIPYFYQRFLKPWFEGNVLNLYLDQSADFGMVLRQNIDYFPLSFFNRLAKLCRQHHEISVKLPSSILKAASPDLSLHDFLTHGFKNASKEECQKTFDILFEDLLYIEKSSDPKDFEGTLMALEIFLQQGFNFKTFHEEKLHILNHHRSHFEERLLTHFFGLNIKSKNFNNKPFRFKIILDAAVCNKSIRSDFYL